MVDQ
jgi:hypothetical protein